MSEAQDINVDSRLTDWPLGPRGPVAPCGPGGPRGPGKPGAPAIPAPPYRKESYSILYNCKKC